MNSKKNICLYIVGNGIYKLGDSLDLITFMWVTYKVTDSILLTGIVAAFNGLPSLLLGLFSGVLSDYYNRKKMIVISDLVRGMTVFFILFLFFLDILNVYILCIATVFISIAEILAAPARRSYLPFIVLKEDLQKRNSELTAVKTISSVAGLGLSGIIIDKVGIPIALFLDGLTFILSGFCISFISIDTQNIEKAEKKKIKFFKDLREGFSVFIHQTIILEVTLIATIVNFFVGGFNLISLEYCNTVLINSSKSFSIINTMSVLGILISSMFLSKMKQYEKLKKLINIGFLGLGVCYILFGFCFNKGMFFFLAFVYGISTGFITVSSVTILQHETPLQHMGKVMAIISIINESSVPFGNLLSSFCLDKVGPSVTFKFFGVFIIITTSMTLLVFRRLKP